MSLLFQFATVLAAGCRAVWPQDAIAHALGVQLPGDLRHRTVPVAVEDAGAAAFDVALIQADAARVADWGRRIAARDEPIAALLAAPPGTREAGAFPVEWLLAERTTSVNTAAAGGNASLLALG